MKTCRACNGQVPENRLAPCPLCGKSKGFAFERQPAPEIVTVRDTVSWTGNITVIDKIPIRDESKQRRNLVIMLISVTLSGIFPFEEKIYTPFVMLTVFLLSSIAFAYTDYMTRHRRMKKSSKDKVEDYKT